MKNITGKIAVVTGGGTGMGRELARQLVAEGCHVATCDIIDENLAETLELCQANNPDTVTVAGFNCDVADEEQVLAFRDKIPGLFGTDHINLLFNNAGIGGGGSFVADTRQEWERTFNISWYGVYFGCRAFLPLLIKSSEGHIINTSSIIALRATFGEHTPFTAYSAAKFAVKGFSEALVNDFRFNAPHLKVSVVMPGHVTTDIFANTSRILGFNQPENWTDEEVEKTRVSREKMGIDQSGMSNDQIRKSGQMELENSRLGGLTPAQAANIILQGVKDEKWRILVGKDTESLDLTVRDSPERVYDSDFLERWKAASAEMEKEAVVTRSGETF